MNKKTKMYILILASIILLLIGFILGFYKGEKIYNYFIAPPFRNVDGIIDWSIIWAAIVGAATIYLGIVANKQNKRATENAKKANEINIINKIISLENQRLNETKVIVDNFTESCNASMIISKATDITEKKMFRI